VFIDFNLNLERNKGVVDLCPLQSMQLFHAMRCFLHIIRWTTFAGSDDQKFFRFSIRHKRLLVRLTSALSDIHIQQVL